MIPVALKENSARMKSYYDVNQPYETLINQIKTVVDFDNARIFPYTLEQAVTTAYDLILSTRYFTD